MPLALLKKRTKTGNTDIVKGGSAGGGLAGADVAGGMPPTSNTQSAAPNSPPPAAVPVTSFWGVKLRSRTRNTKSTATNGSSTNKKNNATANEDVVSASETHRKQLPPNPMQSLKEPLPNTKPIEVEPHGANNLMQRIPTKSNTPVSPTPTALAQEPMASSGASNGATEATDSGEVLRRKRTVSEMVAMLEKSQNNPPTQPKVDDIKSATTITPASNKGKSRVVTTSSASPQVPEPKKYATKNSKTQVLPPPAQVKLEDQQEVKTKPLHPAPPKSLINTADNHQKELESAKTEHALNQILIKEIQEDQQPDINLSSPKYAQRKLDLISEPPKQADDKRKHQERANTRKAPAVRTEGKQQHVPAILKPTTLIPPAVESGTPSLVENAILEPSPNVLNTPTSPTQVSTGPKLRKLDITDSVWAWADNFRATTNSAQLTRQDWDLAFAQLLLHSGSPTHIAPEDARVVFDLLHAPESVARAPPPTTRSIVGHLMERAHSTMTDQLKLALEESTDRVTLLIISWPSEIRTTEFWVSVPRTGVVSSSISTTFEGEAAVSTDGPLPPPVPADVFFWKRMSFEYGKPSNSETAVSEIAAVIREIGETKIHRVVTDQLVSEVWLAIEDQFPWIACNPCTSTLLHQGLTGVYASDTVAPVMEMIESILEGVDLFATEFEVEENKAFVDLVRPHHLLNFDTYTWRDPNQVLDPYQEYAKFRALLHCQEVLLKWADAVDASFPCDFTDTDDMSAFLEHVAVNQGPWENVIRIFRFVEAIRTPAVWEWTGRLAKMLRWVRAPSVASTSTGNSEDSSDARAIYHPKLMLSNIGMTLLEINRYLKHEAVVTAVVSACLTTATKISCILDPATHHRAKEYLKMDPAELEEGLVGFVLDRCGPLATVEQVQTEIQAEVEGFMRSMKKQKFKAGADVRFATFAYWRGVGTLKFPIVAKVALGLLEDSSTDAVMVNAKVSDEVVEEYYRDAKAGIDVGPPIPSLKRYALAANGGKLDAMFRGRSK